jgi:TRAP-type C4-dicarboxylate transport system permease small subunit
MRKYFILSSLLLLPFVASAQTTDLTEIGSQLGEVGSSAYGVSGAPKPLTETIGQIINVALGLLGIIFLILLVYAGFLWMTAAGNTEQLDKAKKILTTSVIGLVIILAAYAISAFVIEELTQATTGETSAVS